MWYEGWTYTRHLREQRERAEVRELLKRSPPPGAKPCPVCKSIEFVDRDVFGHPKILMCFNPVCRYKAALERAQKLESAQPPARLYKWRDA